MKRFSLFLLALVLLALFVNNAEARGRRGGYYYSGGSYYMPYTSGYVVPGGVTYYSSSPTYEYVEPGTVTRSYYYEPSTTYYPSTSYYYPSRSYYYDRSYYSPYYELPSRSYGYYGPGFGFRIGR